MTKDFSESMSNRTDEELIRIVTVDRNVYQTEAVEAAEKELNTRNIDSTKIESVKHDIEEKVTKDKEIESSIVSSGTRLIHTVVDSLCLFVLIFFLSFILGLFSFVFGDFLNINNQLTIGLLEFSTILLAFFLYFVYMEFKFQKTVGKFITKTKVIMNEGRKPELNEIFIRTACRLIPLDNISFIFTKNGFHDRLSNTTVIND